MPSENAVQRCIRPERVDRNGYDLGRANFEVMLQDNGDVWIFINKNVAHHQGYSPTKSIVTLVLSRAEWDLLVTLGTMGPIRLED